MSDEEKNGRELIRGLSEQPETEKTSAIRNWAGEVNARAKVRRLKVENELGAEIVRHYDLQADLSDARGRALEAQTRNSDIETIKMKAAKSLRVELGEVDGQLQEQQVRAAKLDAEAAEILGRHEANNAEEARRKEQAEADTLKAKAEKIRAEISVELARKDLDRLKNDRVGMLAEAEDLVANLKQKIATTEETITEMNDPVLDDVEDESWSLRKRKLEQKLASLRDQLEAAEQRVEDLS